MTRIELHRIKRRKPDSTVYQLWALRWYGTDGRRRCETLGDTREVSKRDAQHRQREKQSAIDGGKEKPDKPRKMTLSEFEVFHREIARGEVAAGSLMEYDHAFRWAKSVLGSEAAIGSIQVSDVAKIRNRMADEHSQPPTIHKTLAYLRAAFNRGVKHGKLNANPFTGFKVQNAVKVKPAIIRTRDEIRLLKTEAPSLWWRALIGLWFTGFRQEEALSRKWSDIDFDGGRVIIRQSDASSFKVDGTAFPILAWQAKSANSYRTVPVSGDTIAALRQLQQRADGSVYVFITLERLRAIQGLQDAGRFGPGAELVNNTLRDFQAIQRRVLGPDVKPCTIHDCRKAFCTHAADEIPIQSLAAFVGDTVAVLTKFYTRTQDQHGDKLRQAFDSGPALKLAV